MEMIFLILIFIIAFLYASVGHGGASGYLALMVIFGMSPLVMRSSVLVLNILVSGIAFLMYYTGQHFRIKLFWPFIVTSVPMAYLGALTPLHFRIFNILLMICLLAGIFRLLYRVNEQNFKVRSMPLLPALFLGSVIGYLSGLIGIGGGILLSPIMLLLRWASPKEVAAISAPFILLNSIAGLFGTFHNQTFIVNQQIMMMIIMAIAGGLLGSFMGSFKWQPQILRYMLALILLIASVKLLFS